MKILRWFLERPIQIWLVVLSLLLIIYIMSAAFREFLKVAGIDPNFLIGFFTIFALLLSIIQSGNDKRYGYNLSLTTAVRSAGEKVIGKLITIRSKILVYHGVVHHLQEAIRQNAMFVDQNNVESKEDVERDMESVAALMDIYFPEQGQLWNDTLDKVTDMANVANSTYLNYKAHADALRVSSQAERLDYAETLTEALGKLSSHKQQTEKMLEDLRNGVVIKVNKTSGDFQKTFRFRF